MVWMSNLLPSWMYVNSLVELSINIWNEWASFLVVTYLIFWLSHHFVVLLLPICCVLEHLVRGFRVVGVWLETWWAFEWSRVKFPESVLLEVVLFTEIVSLLAFPCHLLSHHVNVNFLGDDVCILEVVTYQIICNPVC